MFSSVPSKTYAWQEISCRLETDWLEGDIDGIGNAKQGLERGKGA